MPAALAITGLLLLSACGATGGTPELSPAPSDTPRETSTVDPSPDSATPRPSTSASASADDLRTQPRVAAAIADLSVRESVRPEEVVIAGSSPVTWSDGSIGCPEPGMSYTQAEVEGELLILRVGTGLYQYHSQDAGPFTYCADPAASYSVQG